MIIGTGVLVVIWLWLAVVGPLLRKINSKRDIEAFNKNLSEYLKSIEKH